ncbi:MAG: hypothetical protein J7J06_09290 [Methanosarcinales archaeon]|nr:hypothetical protein [Methanosarcinales archaeon]
MGYEVKTRYGWVPVIAYLDSGADITLLPKSFIDLLDIEFKEEDIKEIGGVGGSKVPIVLADLKLMVCGKEIEVTAAICLVKNIPYLLGREGIFDHFNICFKKRIERFVLKNANSQNIPPPHTRPAPSTLPRTHTGGASTHATTPQMPPPPGSPATKHAEHEGAAALHDRKSYSITNTNNLQILC